MNTRIRISDHARGEARRRRIDIEIVMAVATNPEQRIPARVGREIRQSRVTEPAGGKLYLVRVVVEANEAGETIVTVYRTSRVGKYWREP